MNIGMICHPSTGGTGIVATELVEHGVTGLLHDPDDLDGMAHSVLMLLLDDDVRARVGSAARVRAGDRDSEATIVPRYESFCEEIQCRVPAVAGDGGDRVSRAWNG